MITYKKSGVSIDAGNELVRRIRKMVSKSKLSRNAIGGFSGLFPMPNSRTTFLSGCCDGVGTKLKLAFLTGKHDTVGIDLVAMNVNDLICTGARPLFFLDYFACGKLNVDQAESVVRGIHRACEESGCVLLGGETAEMPGFYPSGEYDLAGFAVGTVEKKNILDRAAIRKGDIVLGLASSGIHSNGYSLVRKIFSDAELKKRAQVLLKPTRIYVKQILSLLAKFPKEVRGIVHVTGGGWIENPPRVLPKGLGIAFKKGSWPIPKSFSDIQKKGNVSEQEMFRTLNMGIGLMLVVPPKKVAAIQKFLKQSYEIGKIVSGNNEVKFL